MMSKQSDKIAAQSAEVILGPNPIVGVRARDLLSQATSALSLALRKPKKTAKAVSSLSKELLRVAKGDSELSPSAIDRRWKDPTWQSSTGYKKWLQSYLALNDSLEGWLESQSELSSIERARLKFLINFFSSAIAPSNFPWQPEAVQAFKASKGESAKRGIKNLIQDFKENKGMPSQVDKTQFGVGQNLANTEGSVVLRTEVIELIQYKPQSESVHQIPVLIVPPQINKYYVFDLCEEKSLARGMLQAGYQVFMVSWRNPSAEHRDWGLAEYAAAIDIAVSATCGISGKSEVNLLGACAGGVTLSSYVATRALAHDTRVKSLTLLVSALDMAGNEDSPLGLFASPSAIEAAKRYSKGKGVLEGKDMANTFAWLRPNDLVWSYWVNNILLGNAPPAFDVLYWNNDSTRLPARLHSEFLDIYKTNALTKPGTLRLHGLPVDLSKIKCASYIVAGTSDHITPWKACYQSTQLFGGESTFVLSNSGHIQSILNPPGNKKASFWSGGTQVSDAEQWLSSAQQQTGSWWLNWFSWLAVRSGEKCTAPKTLGNELYPVLGDAPGKYVYE